MKKFVLAIDAGTTGITVVLLNKSGEVVNKEYSEFKQIYPKPGWVEHDAQEIWQVTQNLLNRTFIKYSVVPGVLHRFLTNFKKLKFQLARAGAPPCCPAPTLTNEISNLKFAGHDEHERFVKQTNRRTSDQGRRLVIMEMPLIEI